MKCYGPSLLALGGQSRLCRLSPATLHVHSLQRRVTGICRVAKSTSISSVGGFGCNWKTKHCVRPRRKEPMFRPSDCWVYESHSFVRRGDAIQDVLQTLVGSGQLLVPQLCKMTTVHEPPPLAHRLGVDDSIAGGVQPICVLCNR